VDIQYKGNCTVDRIGELREQLMEAMSRGESTRLSIREVQEADLAFFQLLHAARQSFAEHGVALELAADLPHRLAEAAQRTGLGHIVAATH